MNKGSGFGGLTAGLGLIATVLVAGATTTKTDYWSNPLALVALGIGILLSVFGVWTLGTVYWGWRQPRTHEERMALRAKSEEDAMFARFAWHDALRLVADELEANHLDLTLQLANNRTFGAMLANHRWIQNCDMPGWDEIGETWRLVRDAYLLTDALNPKTMERFDSASFQEQNDADWKTLTNPELKERQEALAAVAAAQAALQVTLDEF